jgi:hypothetical protein
MVYRTDSEIGEQIRGLLGSRTQKSLANSVDMDPTALNKAIAGTRALSGTEIVLIARELRVTPMQLLAKEEEPVFAMRAGGDDKSISAAIEECSALIEGYLRLEALVS